MGKKAKAGLSKKPEWNVCVEEGRDEWDNRHLKFSVKGSDRDIPPISAMEVVNNPKNLFAVLTNAGWNAFNSDAQREFLKWLQAQPPKAPKFKAVTRVGWSSGAYVLPDGIIGKPKRRLEPTFPGLDVAMLRKYRVAGTLAEWRKKVAVPCDGNSRLMLAVSVAFTGPILRFVSGPKSGGFQIWGFGETGKTTAAMVLGSVWGCHRSEGRREKGFSETWNSTAGKVELTALAHNDGVLILDETKRAGRDDKQRAEVVADVVFKLAEHTEKERLTNIGPARAFKCYFWSTSNLSFAQLGEKGGIEIAEAELGRMADIPLPNGGYGIYETLNGFASGEELSDALQGQCRRLFGTAIRAFVERLIRDVRRDRKSLKVFLAKERKSYRRKLKAHLKEESLKALNRTSGRFATAFAAGSLAIRYKILPWTRKKLLRAILRCQLDQFRLENGVQLQPQIAPEANLRSKLIQYLRDNKGKFVDLRKERLKFGLDDEKTFPGFRESLKGQSWLYLTESRFAKIVGTGSNVGALKNTLMSENLMARSKGRLVVQRRLFDGGKGSQNHKWVYAFKAEIIRPAQPPDA